jgi:glycosyltransferase involved in cell wall biosynthesis
MKILQLIDTLHPGGAEQMAVNYANALLEYGVESQICVTRENGLLKEKLDPLVKVHFLNKKKIYDFAALNNLSSIIRNEKINIIHAHSSSWFFAVLCKYIRGNFKLIWHDHYGNSEFLEKRAIQPLKFFSRGFDGIISVDIKLKEWAGKYLRATKRIVLNNFVIPPKVPRDIINPLYGNSDFNLICVANLRPQKDHNTLIEAFHIVRKHYDVSLHLLGKAFDDEYGRNLLRKFENEDSLFYYGSKNEIYSYLKYSDIGLLSSQSEALPLVLMEYGLEKLPVVCTNVGACSEILGDDFTLVQSENPIAFAKQILEFIQNNDLRKQHGVALYNRINQLYSKETIIPKYLKYCESL